MAKPKVVAVFGTRPDAVKMAPVVKAFRKRQDLVDMVVVVTGQHRDMLDQVLSVFEIVPDYDLDVMEGDQTPLTVTTKVLTALDPVLREVEPALTLVHGDTTTCAAAALGSFYRKVPVGHVEAGLRTSDKYSPYPEEMNRRLAGVIADVHFAPTEDHKQNLIRENVSPERIFVTGNTVIDALLMAAEKEYTFDDPELKALDFEGKRIVLMTAHRRENYGRPLDQICLAARRIVEERRDVEVVFPVHKSPAVRSQVYPILGGVPGVHLIEPVDYLTMVNLMKRSFLIMTDSGGLQEEGPSLDKPVLVLRNNTERPEGVRTGALKVVGTESDAIVREVMRLLDDPDEYRRMASAANPYGDGHAAERVVEATLFFLGLRDERPQDFAMSMANHGQTAYTI